MHYNILRPTCMTENCLLQFAEEIFGDTVVNGMKQIEKFFGTSLSSLGARVNTVVAGLVLFRKMFAVASFSAFILQNEK